MRCYAAALCRISPISLHWHLASASPYIPTVIQATGLSQFSGLPALSRPCKSGVILPYNSLWYQPPRALKREGGGALLPLSVALVRKGYIQIRTFKRLDWTCCFRFSVCCVGCNAAGRSPPDGCADGCRYIWNISRGAVAELCHGTCQVCQGPMLLQPKLKGHFNPGSWGLVVLLSSLNTLHRSRTQSRFTFHWGIDDVMGTRKNNERKKTSVVVLISHRKYGESKWLKWQDKMRKGKRKYRNEDKIYNSRYVIQ